MQKYMQEYIQKYMQEHMQKYLQKGFGFYSPHETTILFLKAALVSIWIGLDLIVVLVVGSLPQSTLAQHTVALNIAAIILATGTVFSILLAWATGTLFGRSEDNVKHGLPWDVLQDLKRKPYHLIGSGAVGALIVMFAAVLLVPKPAPVDNTVKTPGRVNMEIARKCSEIAAMEKAMFRSNERIVMTQCMLQYDPTYASLHDSKS